MWKWKKKYQWKNEHTSTNKSSTTTIPSVSNTTKEKLTTTDITLLDMTITIDIEEIITRLYFNFIQHNKNNNKKNYPNYNHNYYLDGHSKGYY